MDNITLSLKLFFVPLLFILNINNTFASLFSLPRLFNSSEKLSKIDNNYYEDHWQYLQKNFQWKTQLPDHFTKTQVVKQLNSIKKHPNYMADISKRAEPYIYYLSEEIYKRKLPAELALLPIIESAFNPFAYSQAGAAGLWQMMPKTAEYYGVKQNWWYDGRKDIIMSTTAALDYIEKLYNDFNQDWLLTIAAYNSGGGTVRKAIRQNLQQNKPIDFWQLKLPKETKAYIPKLLAFIQIIENPKLYNQTLMSLAHKPYFEITDIDTQIDLKLAAQLSNLAIDDIQTLNPGFNRFATAPNGPHRLVLPIKNSIIFNTNLTLLENKLLVNYQRYTIKKGDTLIGISKKFDTTINVIKNLNNLASNTIRANRNLIIPTRA